MVSAGAARQHDSFLRPLEMGQGVTTVSTLVGEELDVNPLDMEIRLAGAHKLREPDFGMQGTGEFLYSHITCISGSWRQYAGADS